MNRETIEALEDRAATYGLLARLYHREVDEALLGELRRLDWDAPLQAGANGAVGEGARLMGGYLGACGPDALAELAVDFAGLFVVRTAHDTGAPYPYESVYASREGAVMGEARDEVLACYREEGVGGSAAWNLPEDHLALELEFEQLLCARAAETLGRGERAEAERLAARRRAFLERHLSPWMPPFARAMRAAARTDFYRGLALLTEGFVEDDARSLAEGRP